ncbi:hypothetical protein O181_069315 [Austropuccinia psidii MF-1]|uniref:Integrase catalytic domain-containing protein n=1 Tax=Austropuccinia psidii MF-1 TaxID=1389203 RepID=A0A9Q3I7Z2_9BASI|nr:hypothetical protein [Austropuccinia psidii MF-1]
MGNSSLGLVTALPLEGDRSDNACLLLVYRYTKTSIFLPCHKHGTAINIAIIIWDKGISYTGLFQSIKSDREPNFTSELWTNLHKSFGINLSLSTVYHPQTEGLAEIMIQALEDMIKRFSAYGQKFKDSDGFTNDWCTLIPRVELAYKTSVHYLTVKRLEMLAKGWNPRLSYDTLEKYLVDINPI